MMKKRLFSFFLCICMVLTLLPAGASAAEGAAITISSLRELAAFRDSVNKGNSYAGKAVLLTADIDLGGEANPWTPIGRNDMCPFTGTFDGGGHTIRGLYISDPQQVHQGLFGYVGTEGPWGISLKYGTVKNLSVEGKVTAGADSAGLVAVLCGTAENCHSAVAVTCDKSSYYSNYSGYLGGVVGLAFRGSTIRRCYNTGDVTYRPGGGGKVGGVAGECANSGISDCYNTGNITWNGTNAAYRIGGVVGYYVNDNGPMVRCYNVGRVTASGSQLDGRGLGSLAGFAVGSTVDINQCYALENTAERLEGYDSPGVFAEFCSEQKLKEQSTFQDWDFEEVWEVPLAGEYLYPMLRNAPGRPPVVPAIVLTDNDVYLAEDSAVPDLMDYVKGAQGTVTVSPATVNTGAPGDQRVVYTAGIPGFEDVSAALVVHVLPRPAALTKAVPGGSGPFSLSATMTYTGGLAYTETGFVYGALQNPTLTLNDGVVKTSSVVSAKGGALTASVDAAALTEGIVYYARAYAKASDGTVIYGPQSDGFGLGVPSYGSFSIVNNGGNTFTIRRTGGSDGEQTVYYRTQNGSAIGGTHFTHQNGALTFRDGETSKTVTVSEGSVTEQYSGKAATAYSNADRVYFVDIYRVAGGATLSTTDRAARTMAKSGDYTVARSVYTDWKQAYFNADQHTITDKGWANNYEIYLNNGGSNYGNSALTDNYLKNTATQYQLYLKMEVREFDDGNQLMRMLNQYGNATTGQWQIKDGAKGTSWRSDTYFPSSAPTGSMGDVVNQNWSCDGAAGWVKGVTPEYLTIGNGDPGQIVIGFDAAGGGADDWGIKNVYQYARPGDEREPQLLGVAPIDASTYLPGEKFTLALIFDEIVDAQNSSLGVGASKITTSWGQMAYAGGTDSNVLYFTGTVPEGAGGTITLTSLDCAGQIRDMCATAGTQSTGSGSVNVTVGSNPKPVINVGDISNANGTLSAEITAQNAGKLEYVWGNAATPPAAGWQMLANTASSAVTTRQTDGTWYLHARATNADGRVVYARSANPVTLTAEAGGTGTPVTPPALTVTADNTAWAKVRSIAVKRAPADAAVTVKTPAGTTETVSGESYTATQNGVYTFSLTSGDETVTQMAAVSRLDLTAPTLRIRDLAVTSSTRTVTLTVEVEDKGSGVAGLTGSWGSETAVFTDNGNGTWTTTSPDKTGSWTLSVTAADQVGNQGATTSAAYTINADRPVITVNKVSEDSRQTVYTYTVDAKGNTGVSVSLPDGTVTADLTGSVTLTEPGNYYVYAVDDLDHFVTSPPLTVADTVDGEAPVIRGRVESTEWTNQDVTVALEIREQGELTSVAKDGETMAFQREMGQYTAAFTVEENGTYTITATDAAGNVGAASFTIDWIDKILPTISVAGVPEDCATQTQVITFTAADDASGVQSAQYAVAESKEAVPGDLTTLPANGQVTVSGNGAHYIYYKVADTAGNILEGWTQAIIIAQPYQVRFHPNGGSGSMADQPFAEWSQEQALTANAFSAPAEKWFKEWNTKADGSGTGYADKAVVSKLAYEGIFDLYAQWMTCDHRWGPWVLGDGKAVRACTLDPTHTEEKSLSIALDKTSYVYGGGENKPTVTVSVDGTALTENTDYTVTYKDNKNVGTATVTIKGEGNYSGSVEKTFAITAKALTATAATATDRDYNGTAAVAVTAVTLDGMVGQDDVKVNVTNLKGTVSKPDVGSYTEVTLQGLTLTGEQAGNYTLTQPNVTLPTAVTISKAAVPETTPGHFNITNNLEKEYNYLLSLLCPKINEDTVTADRKDWGKRSYALRAIRFDLADYYDKDKAPAYIDKALENGEFINRLYLPVQFCDTKTTGQVGEVEVTVSSTNYRDFTNTIQIMATNKTAVDFAGVTTPNKTYDGQPYQYEGTVEPQVNGVYAAGADVEITYAGRGNTGYAQRPTPPTNAGTFAMIVRIANTDPAYIGRRSYNFEIYKAEGVGSVTMADFSCGGEPGVPVAQSETNGVSGVSYAYKVKGAADETYSATKPTAAGEYTVRATFPANTNYEAVTAPADFTISHAYAAEWTMDESGHWHDCPCGGKGNEAAHVYEDDGDKDCNICGYRRVVYPGHTHAWATAWTTSDTHHWYECTAANCPLVDNDLKNGYGEHQWGEGAVTKEPTTSADGVRTYTCVCGKTRTETIPMITYGVSGAVINQSGTPLTNVSVKLMRGSNVIAETTTGADGTYGFTGVKIGLYNVVARQNDIIKTILVELTDANATEQNIQMPEGKTNSVVEVKGADTPAAVVGGVDAVAEAQMPGVGETVTVKLTVERLETPTDKAELDTIISGKKDDVLYLDLSLFKVTDDGDNTPTSVPITDTEGKVLEIVVPYDFTGKKDVTVYRKHGDAAEKLTKLTEKPVENFTDGSFYADSVGGKVYIYASKFSTYAIGYTEETTTPVTPSRPSSRPSRRPTQTEEPAWPFTDVTEQDWRYEGVKYVYEKGLMEGTSDVTFAPGMTTSRAMIATILWRLAGSPEPKAPLTYPDCKAGSWYAKAVAWGTEEGVLKGYDNGNFGPEDPITREQMAVMLWRYAKNPETSADLDKFVDGKSVSGWVYPAMEWAVEQGIITGKSGGVLDPTGQATRAEAATMLVRYLENKN